MNEKPRLAAIAGAVIGVQVGAALVATRFVAAETGPVSLALMRYIVGVAILLPIALVAARGLGVRGWSRREWLMIIGLGVMQFGVQIASLNEGLKTVVAARAALIYTTTPFIALAIGALLGRERFTGPKLIGVVLTFAGVALALGEKVLETKTGASGWRGEMLCFAAAALAAACSVFYRATLGHLPALTVGAWAMAASFLFLVPIAAIEGFFTRVPTYSIAGWVAIIFIGASSALGYYLWLWALQNTTPTRVTAFLALSPITAALLGVALLGESLSVGIVGGGVLIIAGLWLAQRDPVRALRVS